MIPAYLTGGVSLMDSGLDLSVSDCYNLFDGERWQARPPCHLSDSFL